MPKTSNIREKKEGTNWVDSKLVCKLCGAVGEGVGMVVLSPIGGDSNSYGDDREKCIRILLPG